MAHRFEAYRKAAQTSGLTLAAIAMCGSVSFVDSAQAGVNYWVAVEDSRASDTNSGRSPEEPFRTLGHASGVLRPGDILTIKAGIYREELVISRDGTIGNPIVVEAYPGDEGNVIIRGSDVVTGWTQDGENVWSVPWRPLPSVGFPALYPNVDEYARRRELLFVDGQPLVQVLSASDLSAGHFWMDDQAQRMRVYYPGDLNSRQVEIAIRNRGVYARGRSYLVFRGLTVEHVTSEIWIAAMALGPHVRVEDCVVRYNNGAGIGADSHSEIVRTTSSHNGQIGIGLSGSGSVINSSETSYNSWRYGTWAAGGIKVVSTGTASDNRISEHTARYNNGPGIAFDTVGDGNVIERSFFEGNKTEVIFEAAIGPNWLINNIAVAKVGFRPEGGALKGVGFRVFTSRDTYIYNNTVILAVEGTGIWIGGGERWGDGLHFYTADTRVINNIVSVQPHQRLVHIAVWGSSGNQINLSSHIFDNNLYAGENPHFWLNERYTLAQWQATRGYDSNSFLAEPMFSDPADQDYSLRKVSKAIDAGQNLAEVTEDFVGNHRPQGLRTDIGAFESGSPRPEPEEPPTDALDAQ